jgi:tryptophan synthase alpha chain
MIPNNGACRIARAFGERDSPLLVTCTVAGDPDYDESRFVIRTMADAGADIIELVMPFSDPVADGPVIQEAGARALAEGMTTDRLFSLLRDVRRETGIPLLIMTYANIIIQRGIETFYGQAALAGADGVVVADVPLEEAGPYCEAARKAGIEPILFISPTTSPDRMEKILVSAGGFIYLVAAMGVTGVRKEIEPETISLLRMVKENSSLPVVPGFGIYSPDQVRAYTLAGADGVIVGSAIVSIVGKYAGRKREMEKAIGRLIRELKAATREHESTPAISTSGRKDPRDSHEPCP